MKSGSHFFFSSFNSLVVSILSDAKMMLLLVPLPISKFTLMLLSFRLNLLYFLAFLAMKHRGSLFLPSTHTYTHTRKNTFSIHYYLSTLSVKTFFDRIVESVGDGVTEFEVGDHVLTVFVGECMHCKHCVSGKSNMCQKLGLERKGVMHTDQKTRFSIKGRPVYHYCAVSSFSEYTVVHSGCAVKISPASPMDRICLLSCGVAAGKVIVILLFYI